MVKHYSFFGFSIEITKVVYTTNMMESLNITLRKILKKQVYPSDDAVLKQKRFPPMDHAYTQLGPAACCSPQRKTSFITYHRIYKLIASSRFSVLECVLYFA